MERDLERKWGSRKNYNARRKIISNINEDFKIKLIIENTRFENKNIIFNGCLKKCIR